MIYNIRTIDIWSVVRIVFVLLTLIGVIGGLFYLIAMAVMANFMAQMGDLEFADEFFQMSGVLGVFMILFLAVGNSIFWSIITAILIGIYNLMGGITVTIEGAVQPSLVQQPSHQQYPGIPPSIEE